MKQYYTNNTMFVISLVFSKIKSFWDFCGFGNFGKKIFFAFLLFFFQAVVLAQTYTITGNISASTLSCSTLKTAGTKVIIVGDGSAGSSLLMNDNLDLTCLGPIQLIINNSSNIDFRIQNYDLTLAAGSSITFNGSGTLLPITDDNACSSSDRIRIGDLVVSSCTGQGAGAQSSFVNLVNQGGYSPITATAMPSSICGSESSKITGTASPSDGASFNWYDVPSGGTVLLSGNNSIYNTGTITTTKTYYVSATYAATNRTLAYTTVRKAVTVTVNPVPNNVLNGFTGETICNGSQGTLKFNPDNTDFRGPYTIVYTDGTTNWTANIQTASLTPFNVAVNPIITTNYTLISITNAVGCIRTAGFGDATARITVNPTPTAPAFTQVNPTCAEPTGAITVTAPAGTGITYSIDGATYTNTTGTFTNVAAGAYSVTVKNAAGCISTPTNVTINTSPAITNTWNDVWSTGSSPTSSQVIEFASNYDSTANLEVNKVVLEGCSCQVNAGVKVVFYSGHTLKTQNQVTVAASTATKAAGILEFKNSASLVQVNNPDPNNALTQNTGNIIYNRAVTGIKAKDYVYWSTPVRGQKLADFSSTIKYLWNATLNNWRVPGLLDMQIGQGYVIRRDEVGNFTGTFTGIPNNGSIKFSIGDIGSFNLIGNPYPSALDASQFLDTNSGVLGGTIYFWTHSTAIQARINILLTAGSGDLAYTSDDYAAWNSTGGLKTYEAANDILDRVPSGKIAAGQAFFATSIASGKQAVFENIMRLDKAGDILDNSQFFKINSNSKTSNTIEKNRLWLNLTNTQGAFKQTLIGYIKGATNEYDNVYDGVSFNGNAYIDFYSVQNSKNYAIQGRALPFDGNDIVPLGYKTTIVGEFKIAIDEVDGFLVNKKIYLEDKLLDKTQDLSLAPYTFTTEKGTYNDRFVLSYTSKTLATDDFETEKSGVVISSKNKEIKIQSKVELIDKVMVYDVSGKLIKEKKKIENTELILSGINASEQVFIVKVFLINGTTISKKIIY
ncbi:hypothetical protein CXF59_13395 [Flavobacterium sp. ALD4]|uniref:T9SS sorting signal type C domain-containing protein n=1 Tax=Flavobacterium sp. ALD4 TaxID=2058314 RepID=UPI000C34ABDA|nr:T9SS sorting signal type C domain-containing protein [Flavobacterium sp. ALD4]PKH66906.1 hypothetical protein CXF59_13395 [Flavobacterium sp. ALD4]